MNANIPIMTPNSIQRPRRQPTFSNLKGKISPRRPDALQYRGPQTSPQYGSARISSDPFGPTIQSPAMGLNSQDTVAETVEETHGVGTGTGTSSPGGIDDPDDADFIPEFDESASPALQPKKRARTNY